jgi:hypothetical protein
MRIEGFNGEVGSQLSDLMPINCSITWNSFGAFERRPEQIRPALIREKRQLFRAIVATVVTVENPT